MLVFADWEPPGTFDPRPPTTGARLRDDTLVYGRLWTSDPRGRLVPDLAISVPRPVAGALAVRLRSGLRWSDGTPLTAADVARSCSAVGIGATVVSANLIRLATSDAEALAAVFITPAVADGRVASGPFRLASSDSAELTFERNPHYHGHRPYLATIVELLSASHDAMVESAQAAEVDYLPHLGPADLATQFGSLRTVVSISQREEVIVPAGLDPATVAALSAGADRQALLDQLFGGRGRAAGLPPQPALARFLLAGRSPTLQLVTVCDDPLRASEAAALTAQWTAVGIRVTTGCAAIAQLTAPAATPQVALYSVLAGQAPAGAMPLLRWPGVRAVTPRLHGFAADDTVGTDLWNVADWWLD